MVAVSRSVSPASVKARAARRNACAEAGLQVSAWARNWAASAAAYW